MDAKRLWRTIRLYTCKDRNKYIRKAHIKMYPIDWTD